MTSDTKIVIGILSATVVIIAGAAFFASKRATQYDSSGDVVVSSPERILRQNAQNNSSGSDAPEVTVVEFGDFQCPACGALYPVFKQLKELYADKPVRFVYRHFPLPQHEFASLAANAAEAAAAQGKFWEYHDVLFENQLNLERADLERYAGELGLNMDEFRSALDEKTHENLVTNDLSDGRALGVASTPTLFINDVQYKGPFTLEALQTAIDSRLTQPN